MNVFEGARRIAYILMSAISLMGIIVLWQDRDKSEYISVSYMNGVSLVVWDENSNDANYLTTRTSDGVSVHLDRVVISFDKAISNIRKELRKSPLSENIDWSSAETVLPGLKMFV